MLETHDEIGVAVVYGAAFDVERLLGALETVEELGGPEEVLERTLEDALEALEGWGIPTDVLAELFEALDPAEELEEFEEVFE